MPELLGSSPRDYVLVLEDLGAGGDATGLYRRESAPTAVAPEELRNLVGWLVELHTWSRSLPEALRPANLALRELNHAHIFEIPLADPPAVDLDAVTPGLARLAGLARQERVQQRLTALGQLYLAGNGAMVTSPPCLLHGDFFPGSWLRGEGGALNVIDPEFCYFGCPEFDLGVLVAHLRLARVPAATISALLRQYARAAQEFQAPLLEGFAAAEVIRRLLGVAQLPLDHSLAEKKALLAAATTTLSESR
jgi:5-methylthioribose kinase